ncbi:MAG: type II secretion system F family protein [Candidatus Zixiibacteriota bacterium]
MVVYLILAFVFITVFLIFFAILYLFSIRKDPVKLRLKDLSGGKEGGEEKEKTILPPKSAGGLFGLGSEQTKGTKLWLAQAGYRKPQSVSNYYGARLFGALGLCILSILLGLYLRVESPLIPLLAFVAILVGGYIPRIWVAQRICRRREEIRRSVPSMLDLMVVCVEAGLSLNAAIQKITEETKNTYRALSEELHLVNQEILIGKTRSDALRNLARRTGVDELRSLAVMLIQADKLGTGIANSLRVLADSLRVKRRQKAEEAAHKTSVKLVFPLVLLIFPELLVILVGPAAINLIKTLAQMGR